jgi:hypothetical protein
MTIATNFAGSKPSQSVKRARINERYIVATANDNTATVNGPWIDNTGGRISNMTYNCAVSAVGGTSPTLAVTLQRSLDGGTTAFTMTDTSGNNIALAAGAISAGSNRTLSTASSGFNLVGLPAGHYRFVEVLGGTSPTRNSVSSVGINYITVDNPSR